MTVSCREDKAKISTTSNMKSPINMPRSFTPVKPEAVERSLRSIIESSSSIDLLARLNQQLSNFEEPETYNYFNPGDGVNTFSEYDTWIEESRNLIAELGSVNVQFNELENLYNECLQLRDRIVDNEAPLPFNEANGNLTNIENEIAQIEVRNSALRSKITLINQGTQIYTNDQTTKNHLNSISTIFFTEKTTTINRDRIILESANVHYQIFQNAINEGNEYNAIIREMNRENGIQPPPLIIPKIRLNNLRKQIDLCDNYLTYLTRILELIVSTDELEARCLEADSLKDYSPEEFPQLCEDIEEFQRFLTKRNSEIRNTPDSIFPKNEPEHVNRYGRFFTYSNSTFRSLSERFEKMDKTFKEDIFRTIEIEVYFGKLEDPDAVKSRLRLYNHLLISLARVPTDLSKDEFVDKSYKQIHGKDQIDYILRVLWLVKKYDINLIPANRDSIVSSIWSAFLKLDVMHQSVPMKLLGRKKLKRILNEYKRNE